MKLDPISMIEARRMCLLPSSRPQLLFLQRCIPWKRLLQQGNHQGTLTLKNLRDYNHDKWKFVLNPNHCYHCRFPTNIKILLLNRIKFNHFKKHVVDLRTAWTVLRCVQAGYLGFGLLHEKLFHGCACNSYYTQQRL